MMRSLFVVGCVVVILASCLTGVRISRESFALNNIEKGKWSKARVQLRKSMSRDSINPLASYALARYFFAPGNPAFQVDSAYAYVTEASGAYDTLDMRDRERLRRVPLDSMILVTLREKIDSAAFARAKVVNTEAAYVTFLDQFRYAEQRAQAEELRDEVAFVDAMRENTYQGYREYLDKYPSASRAPEARERYERLLFETKTRDGKLASFVSFRAQYPDSPYRKEAEKQIFEISTAAGDTDSFVSFIRQYPNSPFSRTARNILFSLPGRELPRELMNDSLRRVEALNEGYLVPFANGSRFGFMDKDGKEVLEAMSQRLESDYPCGNIADILLIYNGKLVTRSGKSLFDGPVEDFEELGAGFILISSPRGNVLMHNSGFRIEAEKVEDAFLVQRFLAVRTAGSWSLWTFTGKKLLDGVYDRIRPFGNGIFLEHNGEIQLTDSKRIAAVANQEPLKTLATFESVSQWKDSLMWVRGGGKEGVMKRDLTYWITFSNRMVGPTFFGAVTVSQGNHVLYAPNGRTVSADSTVFHEPWVLFRVNGRWKLSNAALQTQDLVLFDSLRFSGPLTVTYQGDSIHVHTALHSAVHLPRDAKFQFLAGKDSAYFLVVTEGTNRTVYGSHGKKLFTITADRVDYAGEQIFSFTRKNKMGLVDSGGKLLVPADYDAIGNVRDMCAAVLRNKLFGYIDLRKQREIKPAFEKNLVPWGPEQFLAYRNGLYGIIGWDVKEKVPFQFEEIQDWNDTSVLVKQNFQWKIYNIGSQNFAMSHIRDFHLVSGDANEKVVIVRQENDVGVLSSVKGVIVPLSFSEVINLGSFEEPFYFTDKFVEEAGIHVVVYYDRTGEMRKRTVLEMPGYEELHCGAKD